MTPKDVRRLKRLAKEYADWWVEMSWIGSRHPDEHEEVVTAYRRARKRLHDALDALAEEGCSLSRDVT